MSTKNKNTIATNALIEMDNITAALKEESKKTLNTLLTEAVKNALREACEDDDDDCDEYDVIDGDEKESSKDNKSDSSEKSGDVSEDETDDQMNVQPQDGTQANAQPQNNTQVEQEPNQMEAPEEGDMEQKQDQGGEYEDDDELAKYRVGNNTYDLTGEKDHEAVAKVYKLLNNDDQVFIKQNGQTIQLKDNETDTEYVIDFGGEEPEQIEEPGLDDNQINEDSDFSGIAGFKDDDDYFDNDDYNDEFSDDEYDFDLSNEDLNSPEEDENFEFNHDDDDELFNSEYNEINENKKSKKNMNNDLIFEIDLGITDNYQDKDPIAGLSNKETSKTGKSWHKGLPTGTEKPWAGETKSKGKPFEKTQEINEEDDDMQSGDVEEATNVGGKVQERSKGAKSHIPSGRKNYGPKPKNNVSTSENGYEGLVNEVRKIQEENKKLKHSVQSLLKNLTEAYITNYNLGKITKLFVESVTTQEEKVDIVNRFANEAKTKKQSDVLFESIKKELEKSHSNVGLNINETSATANGTKKLNESCAYVSKDLLKTKDLMDRIMNY